MTFFNLHLGYVFFQYQTNNKIFNQRKQPKKSYNQLKRVFLFVTQMTCLKIKIYQTVKACQYTFINLNLGKENITEEGQLKGFGFWVQFKLTTLTLINQLIQKHGKTGAPNYRDRFVEVIFWLDSFWIVTLLLTTVKIQLKL